jgi:hypothetical protein
MPGGGSQPGRSGSVLDGLSLPDALRIKIMRIFASAGRQSGDGTAGGAGWARR